MLPLRRRATRPAHSSTITAPGLTSRIMSRTCQGQGNASTGWMWQCIGSGIASKDSGYVHVAGQGRAGLAVHSKL